MTTWCHKCAQKTETVVLELRSGHLGRACNRCHALRKGHPYLSRREYLRQGRAPMPDSGAEGDHGHRQIR